MSRTLYIGTYAGIPVKIHWTFSFILLLIAYVTVSENLLLKESLVFSIYVLCLFLCVIFHEYGHALTARRYGVRTQDIMLSPIGGMARLDHIPEIPGQELKIAIAGPLVNLILAAIFFMVIQIYGNFIMPEEESLGILMHPIGFVQMLLVLNLVLFAFNLIPAFPMDGGRILRALLSYRTDRLKATYIASFIGRLLSVVFVIIGAIYQLYALLFIGLFVYVMAYREYAFLKHRKEQMQMRKIPEVFHSGIDDQFSESSEF
ncbi:MAG: site-2 protease family protein [Bacteroidia bacterium]|nr:site-2 protease family protein [Bacteroidia bacterium]